MTSTPAPSGALVELLRRWRWRRAGAGLALGAGVAALGVALWRTGGGAVSEAVGIGLCGGLAGLLPWVWERRSRKAQLERLARHLDRTRAELGESAELLLADPAALTPLASLQRHRAINAIAGLPRRGVLPWRRPALAAFAGALCGLIAAGLAPPGGKFVAGAALPSAAAGTEATTELRVRSVTVTPPAYTGRPAHGTQELSLRAEQGARVQWQLAVAGPVDRVSLLFGEEVVPFVRSSDGFFSAERAALTSELYAVRVEAGGREVWRSPSARFEVVPDRPPVLEVKSPLAVTEVAAPAPGSLELSGQASDDYAIGGVDLLITVVAGGGEQISVRESHQALTLDAHGQFSRTLDLAALGVQKDTELYLRVEATDRKTPVPNRTRSETLRVRAAGPAALAASGLDAGVRLQPVLEFFRSQRQIILDTEKLLADQPHIARGEFEQRAQSLAFDQRSLRMRYGALLGEEFESGVAVEAGAEDAEHLESGGEEPQPPDAEQDDAARRPKSLGKPKAPPKIEDLLPAGMVHQHDAQDQATFFTSELRTQLKAVLAEMWSAEGALRVFDPKHALPFEARALVLLKELQQKARVYVPKIGYEAPEIDLARRLTGELDKIHDLSPIGAPAQPQAQAEIRRVLEALSQGEGGTSGPPVAGTSRVDLPAADLAVARRVLAQSALAGDADALAAVDALRVLESSAGTVGSAGLDAAQRRTLERALWKTLPPPAPTPAQPAAGGEFATALRSVSGGGQ